MDGVVVSTRLVGTAVPASVVGTTAIGRVVPTRFVGTAERGQCLNLLVFSR